MVLSVGAGHVHFAASGLLGNLNSRSTLRPDKSSQIVVVPLNWGGRFLSLTPLGSRSASRSTEDRKRHAFRSTPLKAAIRSAIVGGGL